MEVEGHPEEFTFHPMNPTVFYQVRILYQKGSDEIKHVEVLPHAPVHANQHDSSQKRGQKKNVRYPKKKKPDTAKHSTPKYILAREECHVNCATISGRTGELIFKVRRQSCSPT